MHCGIATAADRAAPVLMPAPPALQAAARMAAFPPRDMVLAAARFSRCLYAQLALQEYAPPRGYPMPMPSDPQVAGRAIIRAASALNCWPRRQCLIHASLRSRAYG